MYDETRCSVDELWGLDSNKWKEIDAMPTVQHMIAQVVGRVFLLDKNGISISTKSIFRLKGSDIICVY